MLSLQVAGGAAATNKQSESTQKANAAFANALQKAAGGEKADRDDSGVSEAETRPAAKAPPRVRKRLGLYVVIGLCAVAIGTVFAVVTLPGGKKTETNPVVESAADAVKHDPAQAIKILEANPTITARDTGAQLVLGHAHAARHESLLSLAAYGEALKLDPEREEDDTLRADLRAMADDADGGVAAQALDLWVGATSDPLAKPKLVALASAEEIGRRHAVKPIAEKYKVADRVDWLRAYTLDLAQEASCPARKIAVGRLRALDDGRAVEPLELAIQRKGTTGATRGRPINQCLVDDAKAAISYLNGLPKK